MWSSFTGTQLERNFPSGRFILGVYPTHELDDLDLQLMWPRVRTSVAVRMG